MAKSFKKVIACLLAVLMVAFSMPFTALAVPAGTSKVDIQLQFGVISEENGDGTWVTSADPDSETEIVKKANLGVQDYISGVFGPQLKATGSVNKETGVYSVSKLTLEEADVTGTDIEATADGACEMNGEGGDYDLQTGDLFTVTVTYNGISQMSSTGSAIQFSDNIVPAGFYRTGSGTKRVSYVGTDVDAAEGAAEYVGFNSPVTGQTATECYAGVNTLLGNKSEIRGNYIYITEAADTGVPADVSAPSSDNDFIGDDGNATETKYENNAIIETFVFMLVDDTAPIEFQMYDPQNNKMAPYIFDGGYFAMDTEEGTTRNYCTYAQNNFISAGVYDDNLVNPGSYNMTFMGTNVNVESGEEECTHANTTVTGAVDATCTTDGYTGDTVCADCGETVATGTTIPATGHSYTSAVTKEATCTEAGVTTYTCSKCNDTYTAPIAMTEHTPAADKANVKEATCTEEGYTGDVVCSVCGTVITAGTTIEMVAHTPVSADNAAAATCTTAGKEADTVCSVCGETLSTGAVIPATGHSYTNYVENDDAVAATCTEAGKTASKTATCDNGCGETDTIEGTVIEALGHTPAAAVKENVVAPTYTEAGSYDSVVYCSTCGAELSRDTIEVPATTCDHANTSVVGATSATCTTDGYTGDTVCNDCGNTIATGTTIPAIGHSYTSEVTTEPTCVTPGETTYTCSNCGDTYKEPIAMVAHTPVADTATAKAPTCTEAGQEADTVCAVCDTLLEVGATIPATGHTAVSANNAVEATCTTEGKEADTVCSVCGETIATGATIAKKAHTPVSANNAVAPTIKEAGKEADTVCSVCGTLIEAGAVIPALGVNVTIDGTYEAYGDVAGANYGVNNVAYGSVVTLKATPVEGAEFKGWSIDGKVVSTATTYKLTAYMDVTVMPVFVDAEAGKMTVVFLDQYSNIVASYTDVTPAEFQAAMAAGIPTAPAYAGYTFTGWSMDDAAIAALDSSATIVASYEAATAAGYTVTTDATLTLPEGVTNGAIPYDTLVTVSAPGATAWTVDGAIVAYGEEYSFYVGADINVQPSYDAVAAVPTVTMIDVTRVDPSAPALEFLATATIADGYTQIDHGFVYGKGATDSDLVLEKVGQNTAAGSKIKKASLGATGCEQFALNYGLNAMTGTAAAKAYVTYKSADGTITTIYSAYSAFTY